MLDPQAKELADTQEPPSVVEEPEQVDDGSKQKLDIPKKSSGHLKQKSAINLGDDDDENDNANGYKLRKNWKKSLTRVFKRGQRSTKSNEGDPIEQTTTAEISQEQKWQSLGKIFRRQSCVVAGANSAAVEQPVGENSGGKKISIKRVFSKYLTKKPTQQDGEDSPPAKD